MATVPAPLILGVAALTRLIQERLAESFPAVWVKGEITEFRRAPSGHCYFSLKEGREAVLDCALFQREASRLRFEPKDGLEVEAFGAIDVYPARGRYQLIVQELRPAGFGAQLVALEQLKRRLAAEGLFDPGRKRALPRYPRRIGLVTSQDGAALRDLVTVLRRRWPPIRIVLAHARVQGEGAAIEIAEGIRAFGRVGGVDLIIVGRGGGSLEDLWAFNEEPVVRAIVASPIPVISAVGHEVDTTLADLAADVRAATPSNAAEIAVRDRLVVLRQVTASRERIDRAMGARLAERRHRVAALTGRYAFRRPREAVGVWRQRVDRALERVDRELRGRLAAARARLLGARRSYGLREWPGVIRRRRQDALDLAERLRLAQGAGLETRRRRLAACADRLRALSPRLVLERGYCLARRADGTLVRVARELAIGDPVTIEFARGEAGARVETVRPGDAA